MPKVSIVIPCYNVEKYIVECLESVVNQTLEDIEIICVDDGSTDNTGKIIDEYASKDNRFKVLHKENAGYGIAMNKGFDMATGEYIGIVEPDDYIEPEMYSTLYKKAKENNVDWIKADYCRFKGEKGSYIKEIWPLDINNEYYNQIINPQEIIESFNFQMHTWAGIYNRQFIEKYKIRHNETPGASYQDTGFWFQTLCYAKRIYIINDLFYMYRVDNPNASIKNKEKIFALQKEYEYIYNIIKNNKNFEKFVPIFWYRRFGSYMWNIERIEKKYKKLFLNVFRNEFITAYKKNEISESLFPADELKMLRLLINKPLKFLRKVSHELDLIQHLFCIKNEFGINYKRKILYLLGFKIRFKKNYFNNMTEQEFILKTEIDELKKTMYWQMDRQNQLSELFTQILLEDCNNNFKNLDLNDILNNPSNISMSYWDNERMGLDFFRNFSYLLNKESKIKILNDVDKKDIYSDVYFSWGTRPYCGQVLNIYNSKLYKKPLYFAEDGFLRSIITNSCAAELTKYHRGIAFTFDGKTPYYDARKSSDMENLLNDKNLIITEDQKQRARTCLNRIIATHLSKYNNQPIYEPKIGREGVKKVLVVDQSYGDMSIAKGLADETTFKEMLEAAIRENPDADIIVKTHPDTIAGAGGYYKGLKPYDNVYTQTEAINPISLIKYVDKVYVCTTQFGFEALMCGKEVHVFGMPFYAGWGLTHDRQKCERRTNTRTLEEVFYIAYIMYSYYVNPDKQCRCEIEEAMDYLLKLRDEYFALKN